MKRNLKMLPGIAIEQAIFTLFVEKHAKKELCACLAQLLHACNFRKHCKLLGTVDGENDGKNMVAR